mgnify:CR=1 FL=1
MKTFELQHDSSPIPPPDFLKELNEPQRKAVSHRDGPLLIIAGAGSGKTRVLTYRIAYLLHQQLALPQQILALTFTNKAAREMRERVYKLLPERSGKLWMGTFHSVFARILRVECQALGFTSQFSIYDTSDSEALVKRIITELRQDPKQIRPRGILRKISDAKNQLVSPEVFAEKFALTKLDRITSQVYTQYEQRMKQSNAMDFDDLLVKPVRLFESHPEILGKYSTGFRYILIDEYQDTNHAQYRVTRLLSGHSGNVCVVGDDAQSIYSFRGADIGNILDFRKDYPDAVEVPLEQNYRSTQAILRCADSVIKRNARQLDKTLWTRNPEGEPVILMEHIHEREEAQRVAWMIGELRAKHNYSFNQIAILYRTNYQSRVFEDAFRRHGIPYQLVGGLSFYQRKEIKDTLAYLTLLVNPRDEQSLLRIINEPSRGIGAKTLTELTEASRRASSTVWDVLLNPAAAGANLPRPAVGRVAEFVQMIESTRRALQSGDSLLDATRMILNESGYLKALVQENTHESLTRRDNVVELQNAISWFEQQNPGGTLAQFLQEISLVTDTDKYDENKPAVTMMTVHASKGLEFPVVFVVGLEEDLFPMGGRDGEEADIEEERRLFYVAVTRAEERLYFSSCDSRFRFGDETLQIRSRFIDEVDPAVIRTESGASIRRNPNRFGMDAEHATPAGRAGGLGSGHGEMTIELDEPEGGRGGASGGGIRAMGSGPRSGIGAGMGSGMGGRTGHPRHDGVRRIAGSSARHAGKRPPKEPRIDYDDPFQPGAEVVHPNFGPGRILSRDGGGEDTRVAVFFKGRGQKTLMLRSANLKLRP